MSPNNIDVLVVGAGPVGLFCANELIRHGLTCRIVDKKEAICAHSKALGIHIRTLDVLDDCGLLDEFLKQGQPITGALFKSQGNIIFHANFEGIKSERHFLICLPQNKTEAILYQTLQNKEVQVEWETELTDFSQSQNEVKVTLKKPGNKREQVQANWLIACDGAHSTVRHQLKAEFKGSAYEQAWWLADLFIDWEVPEDHMSIYVSDKGPLACFPMGNKRYRIVLTAPKNATMNPTLTEIEHEFKQRSSDPALLHDPIWITPFSIHHRQIEQYRHGRIFLAGDAAHIHSPMGGQGMNTGIQDIYNLVWKLALVEKEKAKAELLDSYHLERFPVGQSVLKKTDLMTRMILLTNPLAIALRNAFIRWVTSFKKIRNYIITDIAELDISYAHSPIVHQSGSLKELSAGIFVPDFQLVDNETQKIVPKNDILRTPIHHLFIFNGEDTNNTLELMSFAQSLAEQYAQTLQVHWVGAETMNNTSKHLKIWLDKHRQLHQRFGISKPALFLIRPDKYIGIVQTPINKEELIQELYILGNFSIT